MTTIPTLQQIRVAVVSAIETTLGITLPTSGKNVLRALANVWAGNLKLLYLVLGNLQKNIFVDTADSETIGGTLERFGRVKLGRNPFPSTAGVYKLQVTTTVIGSVIPASTTFLSDDTSTNPNFLFVVDNDFTFTALTDYVTVRALTTGIESQLTIGDTLTATAPIANVNSGFAGAMVSTITTVPLAAESLEDYRQKILNSYRLEAQGGAATDYRLWAQDAQGVETIYPYSTSGQSNQIDIYVEATIVDSVDGKGTPTATIMASVASVIEFNPDITLPLNERGRRPLGLFQINYYTITLKNIDVTISGFIGITLAQKTAINLAIKNALAVTRPFVASADILANKNNILDQNKLNSIIFLVVQGAVYTGVTFNVNATPTISYTFINGDIPYLNSINYV